MSDLAAPSPKPRWWRRRISIVLMSIGGVILLLILAGGFAFNKAFGGPPKPFAQTVAPPAPDYAHADAWLAFPGRNGRDRSTPPGVKPIDERLARVDVFFIHPTTYLKSDVWNPPFDAPDDLAKYNPPVQFGQISAFNGCCRLYAPHYRQATLAGLKDAHAAMLAYSDVERAFRYFIAHESAGRPFIIASHSQGTAHAIELLQREVLGTPLQSRLVAAYLIGGYVPTDFASIGLPTCDSPRQTGCVISWNTSKAGWNLPRKILTGRAAYWWQGGIHQNTAPKAPVCVNPLDWRANGTADAQANIGALPFPEAPYPTGAATLAPLVPHLTGATCKDGMLEIAIPSGEPAGFEDMLSRLLGVYHRNDYGIFYANIRQNAIDRVDAWLATKGE